MVLRLRGGATAGWAWAMQGEVAEGGRLVKCAVHVSDLLRHHGTAADSFGLREWVEDLHYLT